MIFSYLLNMQSHPSWVCGLKLYKGKDIGAYVGHTLRGCVDWNFQMAFQHTDILVTPFVGVWIETFHDIWERKIWKVTPFVGVWIETFCVTESVRITFCHTLRGCVDWNLTYYATAPSVMSHTLRGCVDWNLRLWITAPKSAGHTLRGCVDWNSTLDGKQITKDVTPFVGVWIETSGDTL